MADGRFDCVDCGEVISFGASECAECGTCYRYVDGRPVAEGEPEPEQEQEPPKSAPAPFRYPRPAKRARGAFGPSKALAAALMLALGVSASVSVLALLLSLVMEHVLLAGSSLASPDEMALGIEVLINAGGYAVFLAAGVLFLFWIHDANRSARSLGAAGMRYTPRAAVIWWFIPLASLIVPYRAMAELWRVSHARHLDTWQAADTSAVMPCWWTLWLFALVMDRITSANESSGSPSQTAPIVAALVNVAGALLAAYVVFSIQRGLTDKAHGASE